MNQFSMNLEMDEEVIVRELLVAMFAKMVLEGYVEISLKSEDLLEYVPKLQPLFEKIGIYSDAFARVPVDEVYSYFGSYVIEGLIGRNLGYFNCEYNTIVIRMGALQASKILSKWAFMSEMIEKGYLILTGQVEEEKGESFSGIQKGL